MYNLTNTSYFAIYKIIKIFMSIKTDFKYYYNLKQINYIQLINFVLKPRVKS